MEKKIILEVGTNKIKIVNYRLKSKKIDVVDYRIIDTPDGFVGENDLIAPALIIEPLKKALKDMKIKKAQLSVTLHFEGVINRVRELPRVSQKEMKELVEIEAEQFLPYESDNFIIDYRVLAEGERKNDPYFKTLVVAVPKPVVDAFVEISGKIGATLMRIDAYVNSINDFAQAYLTKEDENILIADIGFNNMEMIVYESHNYFASIRSKYGYENIRNNVAQLTGEDYPTLYKRLFSSESSVELLEKEPVQNQVVKDDELTGSLKLKRLKARLDEIKQNQNKKVDSLAPVSLGKTDPQNAMILQSTFNEVEVELSRMIDYFQSRQYGTRVHKIYLLGGSSNIVGLLDHLRSALGMQIDYIHDVIGTETVKAEDLNLIIPTLGCIIGGGK